MRITFYVCVLISILGLLLLANLQEIRILALEEKVIYNRPIANCVEMKDLIKNRPYPPKHGVHSYEKAVPICEAL